MGNHDENAEQHTSAAGFCEQDMLQNWRAPLMETDPQRSMSTVVPRVKNFIRSGGPFLT